MKVHLAHLKTIRDSYFFITFMKSVDGDREHN